MSTQPTTGTKPLRTLRLALAMRGGVSLAVWIGGAIAEIDVFRRACTSGAPTPEPGSRAELYRKMLRRTEKYGAVEIDILAGASAGGLNAVLYGLAQTCGSELDDIAHSTWIEDGGMWELLREPGFGRVPSVLRGDERFYVVMRDALDRIVKKSEGAFAARRLTVELAATLLTDKSESDSANRARFSFLTSAGTLGSRQSTIPNGMEAGTPAGESALDRLALAARATSSFPGAFEPAAIFSVTPGAPDAQTEGPAVPPYFEPSPRGHIDRGTGRESRPDGTVGGLGVNMSVAFPYAQWFSRKTDQDSNVQTPFHVVDGGLFDNIPIDRAIRAIKQAPASGPSERFLLYLDPEPPSVKSTSIGRQRDSALNWVPVIKRSLSLKQRAESARDELGLLIEHNNAVLANRGALETLASQLEQNPPCGSPLIERSAYVQYRIGTDAARITTLLTNPWELCQPPRLGGDYLPLDRQLALRLKDGVAQVYNRPGMEERLACDVVALAAQVRILIAWVRSVESLLQGLDPDAERQKAAAAIGGWKLTLYRWLTVLTEAKHRAVDEVLVEPLRTDRPPFDDYPLPQRLEKSLDRQSRLLLSDDLVRMLCTAGEVSDDTTFYQYLADGDEFLEGTPLADIAARALGIARARIRDGTAPVVAALPQPDSDTIRRFRESPYARFYEAPLRDAPVAELAMLFTQTGIPDTASIVAFDRITSLEPTSDAVDTGVLVRAARATLLRGWVRRPPAKEEGERLQEVLDMDPYELVTSDAKLAGNVLARFGGFLLTDWRRNDWQWGRLDAAAALTRIIDKSYGLKPSETKKSREEQCKADVAALQKSICDDAEALGDVTRDGRLVTDTVGGQTLDALSPHYRFALASRIVPLLYRAVLPGDSAGGPAKVAQWAAQLSLLRPFAVPLPLIADPLRLLLGIATVLLSAALLGVADSPRPLHVVYGIAFLGLGIAIVVGAIRIHLHWRTLKKTITPDDANRRAWRALLDESDRGRYRAASGLLAMTVIAVGGWHLVDVGWPWGSGETRYLAVPFEAFAAAAVLVFAAYRWLDKKSGEITVEGVSADAKRTIRRGVAATSVLALVATALSDVFVPPLGVDSGLRPVVAAVAVAVLVAISLWGWAAGRAVAICVVGIAFAAALLQYVFDIAWESTMNDRILDLLPTLTWMVVMGNVIAALPSRRENYGDPAAVSVS